MAPSSSPSSPESSELSFSCVSALIASLWTQLLDARETLTRQRLVFFLKQHVPILEWLPAYDIREDLQFDLVSGITVGLMIVPQEVSLSAIMGVPPIYGLYTAAVVPMIYPLLGTSRVLSVANGAEVSLLVGSAIKKVESEEERIATGILLSFLSGVVLLFMGFFRLGVIADFFSRPVMGGFISAGGVLIMLSQVAIASWLELEVKSRDLPVLTVLDLFEQFPHLNGLSFALGIFSILVLVGMHELKRRVVTELARVEEEFEDQFAIETSRAISQLSMSVSSTGEQSDMSEDDAEESGGAKDRDARYGGDIELGDVPKPKKRQPRRTSDEVDVEDVAVSPRGSRWADLPAVFTTGSLRRRDYVMSSPWGSSARNSRDLGTHDLDLARSSRQRDLAAITRSTRHGRMDDGVGFSLSDEDYITIERPLDFGTRPDGGSGMHRSSSDETGTTRTLPRMNPTQPRVEIPRRNRDGDDVNDDDAEAKAEAEMKRRVKALASPAVSETGSESADSSTALTGRMLAASSTSIRLLRSKMAVLIALRLVCDLGAFMVCLLGGIVGYLAPEGSLALAGDVPGGYPSPKRPWYGLSENIIEADRLYHLFIDTLSIAIISYMCSVAMAKRLAIKEGYRIRPNQELIALGFSNLVGSFFQGMPSTGGLSRTAVNMQNARTQLAMNMQNARTQLASVITVLVVVLVLYTATSALAYLPKASLASIIIVAGYSLIELKEAKWLYRVKPDEFYVWLASFVLSCLLGVLPGLLSSIFCSLIAVIYKTRRPTVSMLGELTDEETGENRIVELDLYPDTARPLSDVVAIRVEGALYFANCEYIERVVEREVRKRHETEDVAVRGVVIDAGSIMDWDTTTIQMMKHLKTELRMQGIMLAIVNARDRLQQLLETSEFLVGIVHNDARIGFMEAIKAIREEEMPSDESQALTRASRVHSI
ncbi:Sulfate Permease [Phytophthora megakarya]|uniref:Sulfate Permease n=1 Tax=Phytophthora megakarya TaxID=4795 RepID=A0A225WX08_9STRA|nr:Sulfate Permease [Phytophthora megakarya]